MAGKSEIISLSPGDFFFFSFCSSNKQKKQIQYWDVFIMPRNGVGKISHSGAFFFFSSQFFFTSF